MNLKEKQTMDEEEIICDYQLLLDASGYTFVIYDYPYDNL